MLVFVLRFSSRRSDVLTIKLDESPFECLQESSVARRLDKDTGLLGLPEVQAEEDVQRSGDNWQNDAEAAESPAPVDVVKESFGCLGPSKGRDHVG